MNQESIDKLNDAIRDVHDFPKPGIVFKDITPLLADGKLLRLTTELFAETLEGAEVDKVIGIDARGFIFGAALADRIGAGFIPVRKKGKLPWETTGVAYSLEYGEAHVEIHKDAIHSGESFSSTTCLRPEALPGQRLSWSRNSAARLFALVS